MIVKMGRWTAKREILIGNPFHYKCENQSAKSKIEEVVRQPRAAGLRYFDI